jgi:hypothetical protein
LLAAPRHRIERFGLMRRAVIDGAPVDAIARTTERNFPRGFENRVTQG